MEKKQTTILIIAGIIILAGAGYFLLKDTFVTKDGDTVKVTDDSIEYTIDDTTVEVESDKEVWPSSIPSTIPEFTYGDVDTTAKIENDYAISWTVIFNNISENAFEDYKADLEKAGFSNVSTLATSDGSILTVGKEPYTIVVTYTKEENTVGLGITQSLE